MNCNRPVQFFNRYSQQIETEAIYGEGYLRWAYESHLGAISRWALLTRPLFSKWYGWRMNRPWSKYKITPFIERYQLNACEWQKSPNEFLNFNDFFYRQLKASTRPVDPNPKEAAFPADGRHLAFEDISKIEKVFIKGQTFDVAKLIGDESLAAHYAKGSLLLSRLCPVDYHRFHFAVSGRASAPRLINGPLASVSPIALRQNLAILWENKRMITRLHSPIFGQVLCIEIGATCVGSIIQTFKPNELVQKGAEKGYFRFGGSSTILLFEPGKIQFAPDLLENSQKGIELYAKMGDYCGRVLTAQTNPIVETHQQ